MPVIRKKAHAIIIRAAYGTTADKNFSTNWNEAKADGIARSAYHFFMAGQNPVEQAGFFAALTGNPIAYGESKYSGDFTPWLDIEGGSRPNTMGVDRFTSYIETYLETYYALTGLQIGIYTAAAWWDANVLRNSWAKRHQLWVAHWGVQIPSMPLDWKNNSVPWTLHQYSANNNNLGGEYGTDGDDIDLSTFNGDLDAFNVQYGLNISPLGEDNMTDWSEWATSITSAVRRLGETVVDPPDSDAPPPGGETTFDVITTKGLNVRAAPAGYIVGSVAANSRHTIYETAMAVQQGTNYKWGKISKDEDRWIAISHGLCVTV
jgi:GH25 family lysozyme M1 (1,4-beta-N-acetylmuramidase)